MCLEDYVHWYCRYLTGSIQILTCFTHFLHTRRILLTILTCLNYICFIYMLYNTYLFKVYFTQTRCIILTCLNYIFICTLYNTYVFTLYLFVFTSCIILTCLNYILLRHVVWYLRDVFKLFIFFLHTRSILLTILACYNFKNIMWSITYLVA